MTHAVPPTPPANLEPGPSPLIPTKLSGWIAVGITAVATGSWILLPLITSVFGERYPVTDSVAMPIIGLALTVVAAVVNVLVLWLGRQRSLLNILATVLTVSASLFFGVFLVGEVLSGM